MLTEASSPRRTRRSLSGRLRAGAAALTSATLLFSGAQLLPLPVHSAAAAAYDLRFADGDLGHAADVRAAQCLLTVMQRRGGQDLKSVARAGLAGDDATLLREAARDYWSDPATPLHTAYDKDQDRASAKLDELNDRHTVWEESLKVNPPKGYTEAGFQWIDQKTNPFTKVGLVGWVASRFWENEDDLYEDLTPRAAKESVDAVDAIAAERYPENGDDQEGFRAWENMTSGHPMYADDARAFLARGGFPAEAPDPGSMEFRVDVENLKARYASCTTDNPPDPRGVLTAEFAAASAEWRQEVDGQRAQRDTILAEEAQTSADLQIAAQALGEALGQSIIAVRLIDWQAYWLKQTPGGLDYPDQAQFTRVKNDIVKAQAMALGRVYVAGRAAQSAQRHAAAAVAAQQAAYAVADAAGLPRGRGLLYGRQAVQVARASAAAAQAVAKATETASNATTASAADSKTLMALAETQAHASQAEFRRIAAQEAAAQAKAAADGAAAQAALAAENARKAKDAQARAEAAEQTAKAAAADAKAKREIAETERDNARRQKDIAARERQNAATAEQRAQSERQTAADALRAAQGAGSTAADRREAAEDAERRAAAARRTAVEAENTRDVLQAKAGASEAYAAAAEGTEAAGEARTAATQARGEADRATTAATNARAAADQATAAAVAAREAATKAEASASRARAASDGAQRDVAITNAQVKKAHAAAADAIAASWAAAMNVVEAREYAKTAVAKAIQAKADAVAARKEADAAHAGAVRTAGFAYATAQAAMAARDSAIQVIKPANDAIELGSPFKETDASAGLAVLTAQASKSLAAQQAAVAQAKAAQAKKAAAEAAALAEKADADAKAAAVAAAQAADSAARAVVSLAMAQAAAAEAAAAAKAAVKAEADTVEYDRQATADAAAADAAATTAEGYADEARDSADEAERDAASARAAATAAENAAAAARDVASKAEADATAAETAAANARKSAEEAQAAAERTEAQAREKTRETHRIATWEGGFALTETSTDLTVDSWSGSCSTGWGGDGTCDMDIPLHIHGKVYYNVAICTMTSETTADCVRTNLVVKNVDLIEHRTLHMDVRKVIQESFNALVHAVLGDFIDCADGKASGCAWVAGEILGAAVITKIANSVVGFRNAVRTGVGAEEAVAALEAETGLERGTVLGLEGQAVAELEALEGAKVSLSSVRAELMEVLRRRTLGLDQATGGFRRAEMETALRIESNRGVQLRRSTGTSEDWFDQYGRSYDAVGNFAAQYFEKQWPALQDQIRSHLTKARFVPVDVSQFTAAQIAEVKAFIEPLGPNVFIVGG
ncbi:hypothetical protein HTZ77_21405 [Nonomuraea sp. SMC257]|uniref:Methyl-accepting transducer domain-containing protein n=1 Tax=Nonomuraea montanisoli TaxID=2741721 RepID=A0A7Y6IAN8_9ACTN|nr:hypothetical protein [Nonomuraea montanisoli]NUW33970.1 hypothetical protein [Nonomuraea montanisoli]